MLRSSLLGVLVGLSSPLVACSPAQPVYAPEPACPSLLLAPDQGVVTVIASPPDATIKIDDEPVGQGSVCKVMTAGDHPFQVDREGYKPYQAVVPVAALQRRTLKINLRR